MGRFSRRRVFAVSLPCVLVIGAGPAGLSAATRLLEQAEGKLSVRLLNMGHHLGGKACSYSDEDGRIIEHGWHMVIGFYHQMRGLMRRAGIDDTEALVSYQRQTYAHETYNRKVNSIKGGTSRLGTAKWFLGYQGLPLGDRLNLGRFMAQAYAVATSGADLTRHDDLCFRTWAIEHGLRPHINDYALVRMFREANFNFPESISAYHMLQTMKLMSTPRDAELFGVTGGYSEKIWDPIGDYFARLGGEIIPYTMVTDWVYEGRKIVGVRTARPDSGGHNDGTSSWTSRRIPGQPGSELVVRDFDHVISTIPNAVFVTMNRDDDRMWSSSYFRRLRNIRSVSTVSMTVLTRRPLMVGLSGPVHGFPNPLGIVINMKPVWKQYAEDPEIGAALNFVGQEGGFEDWTDQQIVDFTLDNVSRSKEIGDVRGAGILNTEIHRNTSDHERYVLTEPGVQQFRPGPLTPFRNLFLAGDWIANKTDLIGMEGAIESGQAAANLVLGELGLT